MTDFPYVAKIEVDKAPRPKDPKQLAVIDQEGCTGCEACIAFCPVDCIDMLPLPTTPQNWKWDFPLPSTALIATDASRGAA